MRRGDGVNSNTWINESAHFSMFAFKDDADSAEVRVMLEITCEDPLGGPPLILEFPISEQQWRKYKAAVDRGIYELRSGAAKEGGRGE